MGRHSRGVVERRGKQALAIAAAAGSEGLGVALISWGNHLSAQDYTYDVVPWGFWGAFFIALPVIALANVVVAAIAKAAAAEHQRYRAWKTSLPPEQRMAVELAEAAAMTAAAVAWHAHNKKVDARLSASVIGLVPFNPAHAAMKSVTAAMMARSQASWAQQPACDPTAASQRIIARHHLEQHRPGRLVQDSALVTARDARGS
jgi:hypothetical protein